ncbi:hypothetical protein CSQ96_14990 [Janthinobacterium sp. BJB412]|nr:hypothetical protein CSQ96_14990 [Janthinobacterium sp. BJB412]
MQPPRAAAPSVQPTGSTTAAQRGRTRDAHDARDPRQADTRRPRRDSDIADLDAQTLVAQLFDRTPCVLQDDDGDWFAASVLAGAAVDAGGGAAAQDDAALEDGLQQLHALQGIFELLLPGGQAIGVVVQPLDAAVQFLLNAGGGALDTRLRQNKMELEQRLRQRMRKDVRISVL